MRGFVAVVLAMLLVVPSPATAAEAVELAGSTVVTAERSGQLRVSVPHDAVVHASSFATVTGDGRFFGVALTRIGDDTSLKASHMHYPEAEGSRYTSKSIRLDAEDSDDPDQGDPLGVPTGRACSSECRLPAGEYDLLVVTDGAPVQATITIEGLSAALQLDDSALRPLRTAQVTSDPKVIDWGDAISGGRGVSFWGVARHDAPSLAYTQMLSHVDANVAGTFEVTFCVTIDDTCASQSSRHNYAANVVEGREGLSSYGSQDLPAGDHGLEVSYSYDGIGGGESGYASAALFIYP